MKELKPIVKRVESDEHGRNVKVGVQLDSTEMYLPALSGEEVRQLRNILTQFLMMEPLIDEEFPTCDKDPSKAAVGDMVRVRFEEFGMPDKHIPGRVIPPKRVYRIIKITERQGRNFLGFDEASRRSYRFTTDKIVELF